MFLHIWDVPYIQANIEIGDTIDCDLWLVKILDLSINRKKNITLRYRFFTLNIFCEHKNILIFLLEDRLFPKEIYNTFNNVELNQNILSNDQQVSI